MQEPILVVGGYGYRNTGDEAILAGLLHDLAGRRVTVVSRSPAETAALHGVEAIGLGAATGALRRHRTILIGGGGLFGRDMGHIGRLLPAFGLLAAGLGRTVVVAAVGVDSGMTGLNRLLVKRLLQSASEVTVRDAASRSVVEAWGIGASIADDLSAHMAPAPARTGRSLLRAAGVDEKRPVVGLCLTAVNDSPMPAAADGVLELMRSHPELQFCFVPMSQHPFVAAHNDLVLARRLQAQWPQLHVVEGAHHPSAVLSLFAALDAVISMRYHGFLFAERAGTPLIPIPYAAKGASWLAERGLPAVAPTSRALGSALRRAMQTAMPARSKAS